MPERRRFREVAVHCYTMPEGGSRPLFHTVPKEVPGGSRPLYYTVPEEVPGGSRPLYYTVPAEVLGGSRLLYCTGPEPSIVLHTDTVPEEVPKVPVHCISSARSVDAFLVG